MKKTAQHYRNRKHELRIKNNSKLNSLFRNLNSDNASRTGFTLVEILVAITILVTLIGGVFLTLNPITQINKSQDAQRLSDLQSVKTALDLYYNDTKCYPKDGTVQFGSKWSVGNTVYMNKLPQDPTCKNGEGTCYKYKTVTDPSDPSYSCPQWNVLFAELNKPSAQANVCPLSSLSNCTPEGYSNSWACTMSGAVDCDGLLASSLSGGTSSVSTIPTVAPSITLAPTQSPQGVTYPLINDGTPNVHQVTLDPLFPYPNTQQTITVLADDPSKIEEVQVVITSDKLSDGNNKQTTVSLHPPVGDPNNNGAWTYTRVIGGDETYNNTYTLEFFAKDAAGNVSTDASLPLREAGK
jgi:prepilin-type N-terminal cleavage/methylation domain-containing protein